MIGLAGVALIVLATATHVLIERPGVELGRRCFHWAYLLRDVATERARPAPLPRSRRV